MKIFIILSLAVLLASSQGTSQNNLEETNGTQSYFLSPHGLGRTPEVDAALDKIFGQVKVARTTYNVSDVQYIIDNAKIGIVYNPSKQKVTIPKTDEVMVSGGRFQFTYNFNYTKIQNRDNTTGHAYGSVLSDNITYEKDFSFCGGFLCFRLKPSQTIEAKITENHMSLKRMEPFDQTDLGHLEEMLNNATSNISPSNIKHQILTTFNGLFTPALNDSLNHEIFGQTVEYSWQSNSHGTMTMKVNHELHGFGIDPDKGYRIIFVSKIEGWDDPRCDITVPDSPASFEIYGGTQSYQLTCFYESVVFYMHSNGWLDAVLNSDWQVNSFQFYAGDLFDLINNLYNDFSPRAILDGSCKAQKDDLEFYSAREFDANTYALLVTYKCSLKGTNSQGTTQEIIKFTANTRFYILAGATTKTLTFKLVEAQLDNLSFETAGKYVVNNINLATFKVNQVLKKAENSMTFGTNFPSPTREKPRTRVDRDWVFHYDNSHIDLSTE